MSNSDIGIRHNKSGVSILLAVGFFQQTQAGSLRHFIGLLVPSYDSSYHNDHFEFSHAHRQKLWGVPPRCYLKRATQMLPETDHPDVTWGVLTELIGEFG